MIRVMIFLFLILLFIVAVQTAPYTYSNVSLYNINQSAGIAFTSPQPTDAVGASVKNIGDFNDDGYDDILISASNANLQRGVVYIIFGTKNGLSNMTLTPNMAQNPGMIIYGVNTADMLGFAANSAGDVNGDGVGDIIVSAASFKQATGVVYIFYGGKNLPPIIDLKDGLNSNQGFAIVGINQLDFLGYSVSQAGDINNDGVDDIIIGALGSFAQAGIAYVIFGTKGTRSNVTVAYSGLDPNEGFAILGVAPQDNLGNSVSGLGDVNNDGIDDVGVGAYGVGMRTGAAYVIFGKKGNVFNTIDLKQGLNQSQGIVLTGGIATGYFGIVVEGAGDFNKDGIKDILVTAYAENAYAGSAYIIYGTKNLANISFTTSSALDPTIGIKINGAHQPGVLGISASHAGDINKDGIDDIIIGAQQVNNLYGAVYVFFGSKNPVNLDLNNGLGPQQGFIINALKYYDMFGSAVSGAGDMNQDGMDDILVAGYGGIYRPGFAYLLYSPLICSEKCLNCTAAWNCLVCESETELVNGYCIVPKPPSLGTTVNISKGLFDSGSTASRIFTMGRSLSVGLGLIAKIIQNVRFLNISYPTEALNAFQSYGTDLFELPIPQLLYETPDTKPLPTQYSRYDIDPTFLENFWQTIMTILISLACFFVIRLIQFFTRSQDKEHIMQVALKNIGQTAANFLVIQVYSNLDDVIFYFLLDASSTKMSSPSAGISMGAAGFFLILGLSLVFFHCWVLGKYQQAKKQGTLEGFRIKYRFVGTLYEDFKDESAIKQCFFGILILRCVFLVLVIMLLQPPWIQASLLMLTNMIFLGYFIHQRPFKSLLDEISQYFCELCVFAAYLSVLVLSIFDFKEDQTSNMRNGFGKCIVIAGIVLCLGGFILQMIQIFGAIYGISRYCKEYFKRKNNKTSILPTGIQNQKSKENKQTDNSELVNNLHKTMDSPDKFSQNKNELELSYANSESALIQDKESFKALIGSRNYQQNNNLETKRIDIYPNRFANQTQTNFQLNQITIIQKNINIVQNFGNPSEIDSSRKRKKYKKKMSRPSGLINLE